MQDSYRYSSNYSYIISSINEFFVIRSFFPMKTHNTEIKHLFPRLFIQWPDGRCTTVIMKWVSVQHPFLSASRLILVIEWVVIYCVCFLCHLCSYWIHGESIKRKHYFSCPYFPQILTDIRSFVTGTHIFPKKRSWKISVYTPQMRSNILAIGLVYVFLLTHVTV